MQKQKCHKEDTTIHFSVFFSVESAFQCKGWGPTSVRVKVRVAQVLLLWFNSCSAGKAHAASYKTLDWISHSELFSLVADSDKSSWIFTSACLFVWESPQEAKTSLSRSPSFCLCPRIDTLPPNFFLLLTKTHLRPKKCPHANNKALSCISK